MVSTPHELLGAASAEPPWRHVAPAITREFSISKPAIAADVAHVLDELAEADPDGGPNASGMSRE